jgi:hypothetical protein
VEVGADCPGLDVRLRYDRAADAVLDLGCEGPAGWRGWSGAARERFVITPTEATPGYLAGPLEPGVWHVVLGLHRVPVEYELTISVGPARPAAEVAALPKPERPPRRDLPDVDGLRWLAVDFHTHTTHSDGTHTVANLAAVAAARGLDAVAVTDHNTISHHAQLAAAGQRAGIILLPGQEVTSDSGHANAFGDIGWIDFRRPADDWIRTVVARGGVLSVNHPASGDCAWRKQTQEHITTAEIWHGVPDDQANGAATAWWAARAYEPVPIGGSDWHGHAVDVLPGTPTTWVLCADDDVIGGVAAGRTAITAQRDGPILLRVGDELVAIDADATVLRGPDQRLRVVHGDRGVFAAPPGPYQLESGDGTVLAICH